MDKRIEQRVPHHVKFFIHIQQCEEDNELVGLSLECAAIDLSVHGMQLKTAIELFAGTELAITIGIGEPFAIYELCGVVRWVRSEESDFCMGVLLEDRPKTDYPIWHTQFPNILGV